MGWQPGDRSEVDVGEGETGSKTLDHTQLIGVTTGVKDMSLNQKTKAWRRQKKLPNINRKMPSANEEPVRMKTIF